MTVEIRTTASPSGRLTVVVVGEIDMANAARLDEAITTARAGGRGPVVVDLTAAGYFDSAGVRVLFQHAAEAELHVRAAPGGIVAAVLATAALDKVAAVDGLSVASGERE